MDLSDQCALLFAEIEHVQKLLYKRMKNRITSANLSDEKSLRETTGIFPDSKLISWPKVGPFVTPQTWIFSGMERGGGGKSPNPSNQKFTAVWWHTVGGGVFYPVLDGRESFYTSIMFVMKSSVCFLFPLKRTPPLRYCNRMLYSV
jgi:hypothetical protein